MKPTTYIIGAGASADLGMPTGNQLIEVISQFCDYSKTYNERGSDLGRAIVNFREDSERLIYRPGFSNTENLRSFEKISQSLWLAKSIDNYLNDQRDETLVKIGKRAIVASILLSERRSLGKNGGFNDDNMLWVKGSDLGRLNFAKLRTTWYVPFFRNLRSGVDLEGFKKRLQSVRLVIFNYDRCVEHFLINALMQYDTLELEEAAECISKIEIIHPYGSLGLLPWQTAQKDEALSKVNIGFGDLVNIKSALNVAEKIKTFSETQDEGLQLKVQDVIKSSVNLIFLGFGFAEQNLKLLRRYDDLSVESDFRREIFATGYGLSGYHQDRVRNELCNFCVGDPRPSMAAFLRDPSRVRLLPGTASDLINEYGHLFT